MLLASAPNDSVVLLIVVGVMAAAATPVFLLHFFETKRLRESMRRRHEQRLQDRVEMFQNMWRDESFRRERLEQTIAAQRSDQSPVSVPVTHCEHRERRRRFLPLEDNTNAAR